MPSVVLNVTDAVSGLPVDGARADVWENPSMDSVTKGAVFGDFTAGSDGIISIPGLTLNSSYIIEVSKANYTMYPRPVFMTGDLSFDILLVPTGVPDVELIVEVLNAATSAPVEGATVSVGGFGLKTTGANGRTGTWLVPQDVSRNWNVFKAGYNTQQGDYIPTQPSNLLTVMLSARALIPADFEEDRDEVFYAPGGTYGYLNDYAAETGKNWKMTVNYRVVTGLSGPFGSDPGEQAYASAKARWALGYNEYITFWEPTGMWYMVYRAITLEEIAEPPADMLFGTVTDSITTAPIQGAKVSWQGVDVFTDAAGYYEFIDPVPATATLDCTFEGYFDINMAFTYESGPTGPINFGMVPETEPEPPEPGKGTVWIYSDPQGAKIWKGGIDTGKITPATFQEDPGKYIYFVDLSGYKMGEIVVDAFADATTWGTFVFTERVVPSAIKQKWIDYFNNPGIVDAIELAPSAVRNSWSKVFTGWDYIEDKPANAGLLDYLGVGLQIGGLALAGVTAVMSLLGSVVGVGSAAAVASTGKGIPLAATTSQVSTMATATTSTMARAILTNPSVFSTVWAGIKTGFMKNPLLYLIGGTIMVQQLDVAGWGFGLLPESIHRKAETLAKAIKGDLINLDKLVKAGEWDSAGELVQKIRVEMERGRDNLEGAPVEFWEYFGFTLDDARAMFDSLDVQLDAYVSQYPSIVAPLALLPDEITGPVTEVVDGDTIVLDGKYRVRFVGIDTHEIGTPAGVVEKDYLVTLIGGNPVTVKIDEHNQYDVYARVLGVPFEGTTNLSLAMLERFGKDILTPAKFQDRNKYVDWNENERWAEEGTPEITFTSSPTGATIWIDDVFTGYITPQKIMFSKGEYVLKLRKPGYEDLSATFHLPSEKEIRLEMIEVASPPTKITKPSRTMVEDQLRRGVIDEAEARAEFANLGYAAKDIEDILAVHYIKYPPAVPGDVGVLKLSSTPTRAKIFIGGIDTLLETAETIRAVPVGTHTIRLELAGYAPDEFQVTILKDQTTEEHRVLAPFVEPAPPLLLTLAQIEAAARAHSVPHDDLVAAMLALDYPAETAELAVTEWEAGRAWPPAPAGTGSVSVTSIPDLGNIFVDGDYTYKMTNAVIKNLSAGVHTIKVQRYAHVIEEKEITVEADTTVSLHFDLVSMF